MILVVVVKNAKKSESLISSDFDSGLINKCQLWTGKISLSNRLLEYKEWEFVAPLSLFVNAGLDGWSANYMYQVI